MVFNEPSELNHPKAGGDLTVRRYDFVNALQAAVIVHSLNVCRSGR